MPTALQVDSTLTDRYQTTVPETVRRALRLKKRDKVRYSIQPSGEVLLSRADADEDADPALVNFLQLVEKDIQANPQHIQPIQSALVQRIHALVDRVEVDLDAALPADE